jgi:hypothetical protein
MVKIRIECRRRGWVRRGTLDETVDALIVSAGIDQVVFEVVVLRAAEPAAGTHS